jgi:hypothetical protein
VDRKSSSAAADRFARRHPQRWLIIAGFCSTAAGMLLLLLLVRAEAGIWRWIPGLLLFGIGVGTMLTSSVNVVQSSFPESDQGEISGLSPPRRRDRAACRIHDRRSPVRSPLRSPFNPMVRPPSSRLGDCPPMSRRL